MITTTSNFSFFFAPTDYIFFITILGANPHPKFIQPLPLHCCTHTIPVGNPILFLLILHSPSSSCSVFVIPELLQLHRHLVSRLLSPSIFRPLVTNEFFTHRFIHQPFFPHLLLQLSLIYFCAQRTNLLQPSVNLVKTYDDLSPKIFHVSQIERQRKPPPSLTININAKLSHFNHTNLCCLW